MMHLIWLFVAAASIVIAEALPPQPIVFKCPEGCNCTDQSAAICNTLDLDPFDDVIATLKIVNPEEPLVLTENIFHDLGLKSVNFITIENATIAKIDEQAFSQLVSLILLKIVNCDILEFPSRIVSSVTTLSALNLSGSNLRNFTTLISDTLEEIDMSNCKITEVTEVMFNNLPELTYLNLENNNIRKIHPLAFVNLTNLEELSLARNNLTHLMPNLLENNLELNSLDLSYNPISKFNLNIVSLLEKLILKNCDLTSFNTTVGTNFDLLYFLDLSENKIESMDKSTFANIPALETIKLSGNKLSGLDVAVFDNNSKLSRIILDNNNIRQLPKFTNKKGYFETFSFSCNNCNLTEISPESFTYMRGLNILRISNNSFMEISPEVFENMVSLKELDISYNQIGEFKPNTFAKLSQLEKVNIAGNPLKQPLDPNLFYQNKALKSLDASSCHLKKLWSDKTVQYFTMSSIKEFNIANNELRSVSPRDLQVVTNLQVLDIRNNPLECTQVLRDTIVWLTERGVYPSTPFLKTHESLEEDAAEFEETEDKLPSWTNLAKEACKDEDFFDTYDEIEVQAQQTQHIDGNDIKPYSEGSDEYEDEDDDYSSDIDYDQKGDENITLDEDDDFDEDDDKLYDEVKTEIDLEKLAVETRRFREKTEESYSYLSPTLVFILTAASVLVIAANVMLLILRSRGALVAHHNSNLPHIKILQWGTMNKLKKHSGSVYQQLSEEKSAPSASQVNRYQKIPTVHNPKP